ncbi:hypothetical protein M3Y94_00905900 [Aphelenchoides besseyi]|nr:hypothetical protein M3Y94_00905900 [Aphelenchoides besseyi]KAI6223313.1 hypothetical protein M3Y95_00876500 [Aphelenchoides besseyi]
MSRLNSTTDIPADTDSLFDYIARSAKLDSTVDVHLNHSVNEEAVRKQRPFTSDPIKQTETITVELANSTDNLNALFTPPSLNSNGPISSDSTTLYPFTTSSLCLNSSWILSPHNKSVNEANQLMSELRDMTMRLKQAVDMLADALKNKKCERSVCAKNPMDSGQSVLRRIALESANGHDFVSKLTTSSLSEHINLLEMLTDDYVQLNKLIVQHSSV